ncbi:MAG: lipoyl(octanoyl) transferase LipB [Armatimonadetes bacterium]|nr:lipoyl(octanoyl) transferase LipB [Armatimonadota bacterium]
MTKPARLLELGHMEYRAAWDEQLRVMDEVREGAPDTLILVEHPKVLTLGANFHEENLLFTREKYAEMGVQVEVTDRGGDVTYHGPGQQVIYPIFDVSRHGKDLHKWMRDLEETMIHVCRSFGLTAVRNPEVNTGAWVNDRKIAAIGVKVKRWVNIHGIALNCENDLSDFSLINPCGITTHGVTSLSKELQRQVPISEAKPKIVEAFSEVFDLSFEA